MKTITDDEKLDAESAIRQILLDASHSGVIQHRPSVCHMGMLYGQIREVGIPHESAKAAIVGIANEWLNANWSATVPGIRHVGDDEVLALVSQVGIVPVNDWGGLFDLGVQLGQRAQIGMAWDRAYYETGEWLARWYGGNNPWPKPTVDPVSISPLTVESDKRWFRNAAGRFDYREISAFSLGSRMLRGQQESHVRPFIRFVRSKGITVLRVICTLDGGYWNGDNPHRESFQCSPNQPGYWERMTELVEMAAEEGCYVRLVFLGATEPFGGVWHPDRRDIWNGDVKRKGEEFVLRSAEHYRHHSNVLYELANEPGQIGLRESFSWLIDVGRKVKGLAPNILLGGGAVDGPNDQDTRLCVAPFDYVDAHIERRMGVGGFEWVKRSGEYALIDQEHVGKQMPFISGEPVNFGEWRADGRNSDVERSPSVAFAYGAVSRARQYNTNFHYDGGLWTTIPKQETIESLDAYSNALNAFPMLTDSKWRGHWRPPSYFKQVWPNSDAINDVERHIQGGHGPWRVFGCGTFAVSFPEPKHYAWPSMLEQTALRVADEQRGVYDAAIYRKT